MGLQHDGLEAEASPVRFRSAAARARLRELGWAIALDDAGLVEWVLADYESRASHADRAGHLLDLVDEHDVRPVRRELGRFLREARAPDDLPLALVGGEGPPSSALLDVVLLEHFGRVSRIPNGVRFVARAIHDQPDLALVHDDLDQVDATVAALLLRVYAPATAVVILTDDDDVKSEAEHAGVATCSAAFDAGELDALLVGLTR